VQGQTTVVSEVESNNSAERAVGAKSLRAKGVCLGNYLSNFATPSTSPTVVAA